MSERIRILTLALSLPVALGAGGLAIGRPNQEVNRGAELALAASREDVTRLRYLLGLGYDVNCRAYATKGRSPLAWAVLRDNHEVVQILFDAGAAPSPQEATLLLHLAKDRHDGPIVELFAKHGYK